MWKEAICLSVLNMRSVSVGERPNEKGRETKEQEEKTEYVHEEHVEGDLLECAEPASGISCGET